MRALLLCAAAALGACTVREFSDATHYRVVYDAPFDEVAGAQARADAHCAKYGKRAVLTFAGPNHTFLPEGMVPRRADFDCVA